MEPEKVTKLISLIDTLVSDLHKNRAMKVHARINQFYYMQKVTELQVLHDQLEIAQKHFQAKQPYAQFIPFFVSRDFLSILKKNHHSRKVITHRKTLIAFI